MSGFKAGLAEMRTSFPDLNVKVERVIAEGDFLAVQFRISGTQLGAFMGAAPTGKTFNIAAIDINRLSDGQNRRALGRPRRRRNDEPARPLTLPPHAALPLRRQDTYSEKELNTVGPKLRRAGSYVTCRGNLLPPGLNLRTFEFAVLRCGRTQVHRDSGLASAATQMKPRRRRSATLYPVCRAKLTGSRFGNSIFGCCGDEAWTKRDTAPWTSVTIGRRTSRSAMVRHLPGLPGPDMRDVVCLGDLFVDLVPHSQADGHWLYMPSPGGAPGNVAAGLAKLGHKALMVSRVGDDAFGRLLIAALSGHGVDVSGIVQSRTEQSGLSIVTLDESGDRSFMFYHDKPADQHIRAEDIAAEWFAQAKMLHVGILTMASPVSAAAQRKAMDLADANGLPISCDVNFRPSMWDSEAAHAGGRTGGHRPCSHRESE